MAGSLAVQKVMDLEIWRKRPREPSGSDCVRMACDQWEQFQVRAVRAEDRTWRSCLSYVGRGSVASNVKRDVRIASETGL